jgi:transcriptional regulator with XRE-family HTH domain
LRAESRRPIEDAEIPYLEALAGRLAALRTAAGLSRNRLASAAEVRVETVLRIEAGVRRTRRSTLGRIGAALAAANPARGGPDHMTNHLVAIAGPALAAECPYAERNARRRARRARRRATPRS